VETEVGDIKGVTSVEADMSLRQARISFEPPATEDEIRSVLLEINYPAENESSKE
jgi:copper chaperone CopZ